MKQIMAYQFRLYPNKEQQVLISKTFGSARFIYNTCLTMIKNNKNIAIIQYLYFCFLFMF